MMHQNQKTFVSAEEISQIDTDVKNGSVFLALSKPTSKKVKTSNKVPSPSMKAYKTSVWAATPS